MSVKQMGQVWDLDLPPLRKLVLAALADHADHDGEKVYPSVGRIAHKTGLSHRQVQYEMKALRDEDRVIALVRKGGGRSNPSEYKLTLENGALLPPFQPKSNDAQPAPINSERVQGTSERVQDTSLNGAQCAPEPSVTVSNRHSGEKSPPRIDLVKVLVDDLDTLDVYLSNDEKSKYAGQIGQLRRKEVSDKRIIRGLKRLVADWDRYPHTSVQKALSFAEGNTHHSEAQEKPTAALAGSPPELVESLRNVAELKRYAPLAQRFDFTRLEKDQQPDWPIFSQLGGDDSERYRNLQRIVSRAAKANAKATCSA